MIKGKSLKKYIILTVIAVIMILTILFIKGFDRATFYCDAFFVTGFTFLCFGGLSFVSKYGAFHSFGYSGYYIANSFRPRETRKYDDYHDYISRKEESRNINKYSYVPYLVVGFILFVIALIIFLVI